VSTTREIAQRYMDLLCAQKFAEAFDMLAPNANYRIIGTTAVSAPMSGRETVKATLVPALASFRQPPKLTCHELIVDGSRAVGLASGSGVGPTGLPYDQPHYAMVLGIENGQIQSVIEFADTVAVEVSLLGNKLVPA
jgi:ketosteroid isomerase-like protein